MRTTDRPAILQACAEAAFEAQRDGASATATGSTAGDLDIAISHADGLAVARAVLLTVVERTESLRTADELRQILGLTDADHEVKLQADGRPGPRRLMVFLDYRHAQIAGFLAGQILHPYYRDLRWATVDNLDRVAGLEFSEILVDDRVDATAPTVQRLKGWLRIQPMAFHQGVETAVYGDPVRRQQADEES